MKSTRTRAAQPAHSGASGSAAERGVLHLPASPPDGLWTQREAAAYLRVSARYLRGSDCPKLLLPGTGPRGKPLVRYAPEDVRAWADARRTTRRFA